MVENCNAKKYCSLYVNDMHLIVMLIPYIEKELESGNEIVTILEDSLDDEVNTFIGKVNLGKLKKNKIKKIRWDKNLLSAEQIGEIRDKTVLVKGNYDFVNNINKNFKKDGVLRIINCFTLDDFEGNSREILENHDAILNTLGIKKIPEMFKTNKILKMK